MRRSEVQGIMLKAKFPNITFHFVFVCIMLLFPFCFTMWWFRFHLGCWGLCYYCIVCVFVSYYIQVHVLHSQFNSYFFVIIHLNYVDVRLCFCLQYYGQFVLFCSSHGLFHFIGFVICMWYVCFPITLMLMLCYVLYRFVLSLSNYVYVPFSFVLCQGCFSFPFVLWYVLMLCFGHGLFGLFV